MVDRFLLWLSAGVVTAGMSAAMIAGAGLAAADDGSASGTGGGASSESSNSTGSKEDSANDAPAANAPDPNKDDDKADGPVGEDPSTATEEEEATEEEATDKEEATDEKKEALGDVPADPPAEPTEDDTTSESDTAENRKSSTATVKEQPTATLDKSVVVTPAADEKSVVEEAAGPSAEAAPAAEERALVVVPTAAADTAETAVTAMAFAAPASSNAIAPTAAAPQIPGIIRAIATIVFNLYAIATRLVGGPPILPANSSVTVRSSTLVLECGCDEGDKIEVPADWYIPEVEEGKGPPDRLIYLQHGFLASGPWYSHTAAALAEQTNSIVVAPSITSNFLAADACWLGAPPMHQAIAKLFDENNTALADSAEAADYFGPIPDRVVLIGHSLGGGAVAGTARYMVYNDTDERLAGVVLLDGVGLDGTMAASLKKVPTEIPIYQLAAPKYFWNQFGVGTDALLEARPDTFIGVTLVGGSHVDAMRGGNPLIQFSQQLVSGFSKPQNVAAARMLMVGWVNDMFAGNKKSGIYAEDLDVPIDTPAGPATAVALPNSLTKPFLLNPLQALVPLANGFFTFEPTCVAESMGVCAESIAA